MPWAPAKTRFLKLGVTALLGLIAIQYWLRGLPDMRHLEPLFTVNMTRTPPWTAHPHTVDTANVTANASSAAEPLPTVANESISSQEVINTTQVPLCPSVPPGLQGRIKVVKTYDKLDQVEALFTMLTPGGGYRPLDCKARDRVAIIVPYRDREEHLAIFLYNLHRLLMKQMIDYAVYIVEQSGTGPFNRGKLMNIGFVEAKQDREFDCFVFHDVDLLPEDDRNLYTCPEQPRHMSVAVDSFKYRLPYKDLFGGVSALTREHFELVNGFSNLFWGWGGEDDDISYRIRRSGLYISRYPPSVARYMMLHHKKAAPNKERFKVMQQGKKHYAEDGLNSLSYERKDFQRRRMFTWILVDLQPPS